MPCQPPRPNRERTPPKTAPKPTKFSVSPRFFRFSRAWICFLAAAIPLTLGCVQRRMLIRTDPPGALVYVDDYEIGTTPIATNFTYYGTRKIRIVKDGFETLTVEQPIDSPWYPDSAAGLFQRQPDPWRNPRPTDFELSADPSATDSHPRARRPGRSASRSGPRHPVPGDPAVGPFDPRYCRPL